MSTTDSPANTAGPTLRTSPAPVDADAICRHCKESITLDDAGEFVGDGCGDHEPEERPYRLTGAGYFALLRAAVADDR